MAVLFHIRWKSCIVLTLSVPQYLTGNTDCQQSLRHNCNMSLIRGTVFFSSYLLSPVIWRHTSLKPMWNRLLFCWVSNLAWTWIWIFGNRGSNKGFTVIRNINKKTNIIIQKNVYFPLSVTFHKCAVIYILHGC